MHGSTEVGSRIRAARKRAGLSQKAVAEKLEMEQATFSKIELGKIDARSSAIATIAETCGVSADWILFGRGAEPEGEGRPLSEDEVGDMSPAGEKGRAA